MPVNRRGTEIFSVFGQIEAAAAEYMIGKGMATKIPPDEIIPNTAAVNDAGASALFAVIVPRQHVPEFERVCRNLRA